MPRENPKIYSDPSEILRNSELPFAQFTALNEISAVISQSRNLSRALDSSLDRILALTHADVGAIHLCVEHNDKLRLTAWRGLSETFRFDEACIPVRSCLCGEAAFSGRILSSSDLDHDERVSRDGCRKERFQSIVSIPLKSMNRVVGILTIYSSRSGAFDKRDEDLLGLVGAQIGLAVDNALLYGRIRNMTIEEERGHIAKELHDGVAQSLAFLNLQARQLDESIHDNRREEAALRLGEIQQVIRDTNEDVRELLVNFRLKFKDGNGFYEALSSYAEGYSQRTGIRVHLKNETGKAILSPDSQAQMFRVVQESLSNVRKHSKADAIHLTLKATPTHFEVRVRDNGCGFDPHEVSRSRERHMGLEIMKERVAQLNGEFTVRSSPGKGTALTISVPLNTQSG